MTITDSRRHYHYDDIALEQLDSNSQAYRWHARDSKIKKRGQQKRQRKRMRRLYALDGEA